MRVGILTGGGDAPGLNAVIRGFTIRAEQLGIEVVGVRHGWKGIIEREGIPLRRQDVIDMHRKGGTMLKSSRTNPVKDEATIQKTVEGYKALRLDAIVACGGDDTLGALAKLAKHGINGIGVPKTIDNDLPGTDVTFGHDTAINIVTEALDRLHTTADSHERCLVVEIMGRHAGWITLNGGLAGGAHVVLTPEEPIDLEQVAAVVKQRDADGHRYTLVAVSEGAKPADQDELATQDSSRDEYGHVRLGGIGEALAKKIEEMTGKETRHVVLGHLQRGGAPTAFDRVLGLRLGVEAAERVEAGDFGKMLSVRGLQIVPVPIQEAAREIRTVPADLLAFSRVFRGE
jgi:6-phosphofructokinase 1